MMKPGFNPSLMKEARRYDQNFCSMSLQFTSEAVMTITGGLIGRIGIMTDDPRPHDIALSKTRVENRKNPNVCELKINHLNAEQKAFRNSIL
jgi:hypothetical protein